MRLAKILIFVILIFLLVGVIGAYLLYNKPHRSVDEGTGIQVTAAGLFKDYETDEVAANAKYLDQVVEVSGKVSDQYVNQQGKTVVLLATDHPLYGIQCTLDDSTNAPTPGEAVTIKGICTGYLSDVIVIQARVE
jgi:ABC-type molybdate transport system substrate-binding protein